MKIPVTIEGKKYKLSFWKWIAYRNQKRLECIEKKIDLLLNQSSNQRTNEPADDGEGGTN